jgi:single-strand DNA-binding protein
MANVNKVILVGRLTRDPECRTFSTGGKVANFGFAVSNRKKNAQTGHWEDEPMFLDCKAFNRGDFGKLADIIEQYLKKGSQAYLEGKLHLESWDDKTTGAKRSKHVLYVDAMQMLDSKGGDRGASGPPRAAASADPYNSGPGDAGGEDYGSPSESVSAGGDSGGDIPF